MKVDVKSICALLIVLYTANSSIAQSCLPDGIWFSHQSEVDSFSINYPNCTEIGGTVDIIGDDITNLNGLSAITSIGGQLWIRDNPILSDISGLSNLTTITGDLNFLNNPILLSLNGFNNLTSVEYVDFFSDTITSLNGLNSLSHVGGDFHIGSAKLLTDISALSGLTSIGGALIIVGATALENFNGLNNLKIIGRYLTLLNNSSLTSLYGLNNLSQIGEYFEIKNNDALTSLNELDSLISVGSSIEIWNNDTLINLNGLERISSINGRIYIYDNMALANIEGIKNISAASISDLYIINNNNLSTCEVQSICDYLSNPNGTVEIHSNKTGCNSQQEVEDACLNLGVEFLTPELSLGVYPNPFSDKIIIETTAKSSFSILNLNGQLILQKQITEPTEIDVDTLPRGIYIVKVTSEKNVKVGKFVKQ